MPINVLVVDDSVVIRRLVSTVLEEDPDIRVAGTAANGRLALAKLPSVAPDLITLDIEMPELDGLGTLRELRKTDRTTPVVMFSTLTERAAKATLEALALGANDYVTKPANVGSVAAGMESVRAELIPKIKSLRPDLLSARPARLRPAALPSSGTGQTAVRPATATNDVAPQVLAIGCSTGGPEALAQVLQALPRDLPVPIVAVQHMPPVFTAMFAQRLNASCGLTVREARDGDALVPGTVLIAPGDHHMRVRRTGPRTVVTLDQGPQENFCRPAVDPLFRSVADVYGGAALAVVLTGMGSDGRRGAEQLRELGCEVVVQDEQTSVVWGMPGAIATAGLATAVLPLNQVAPAVLRSLGRAATQPTPQLVAGGPA
ncbi:MAG: chemotaxis response regulator protein-glutamate methylesterase [Actinomycetota bacterium]|nr:chemotaxis response regulator protein-glutamate methylesterase [Actinomycetota bacterium]